MGRDSKQTGVMEPIVAFCNFANVPKKCVIQIDINIHVCLCHRCATKKWSPNGECCITCTVVNGQ